MIEVCITPTIKKESKESLAFHDGVFLLVSAPSLIFTARPFALALLQRGETAA